MNFLESRKEHMNGGGPKLKKVVWEATTLGEFLINRNTREIREISRMQGTTDYYFFDYHKII